nr:hypothetical protein [Tanacetum cinerariifolium]
RRAHHHRDGRHDPLRLHDRFQRLDAPGADSSRAPLRAPQRQRSSAQRAAVDAERPGRPGAGKRSGVGAELAHGALAGASGRCA